MGVIVYIFDDIDFMMRLLMFVFNGGFGFLLVWLYMGFVLWFIVLIWLIGFRLLSLFCGL